MEAVLAAAIGALAVLASNWLQGRREKERHQRDTAERAAEAGRARAREAALSCDRLLLALAKDMPVYLEARRSPKVSDEAEKAISERVRASYAELEDWIVDLPAPVQRRVDRALELVRDCDSLGRGSHYNSAHYHTPAKIARHAIRDAHAVLTAFLRNELTPEPSEWIVEYYAAYDAYQKELEWEFVQEIHEDADEREKWLAANPAAKEELRRRGFHVPGSD